MELLDQIVRDIPLQRCVELNELGVRHGFTTRLGGVSEGIYASLNLGANRGDDRERVRENYRRLCDALEVDAGRLVFSSQVHGDTVRCVTSADAGKGLDRPVDYDADGLVTDVPGLTLVVFGADCLTVLLHDPVRQVAAAVHAGWRGTAAGIVERAVEKMVGQYGCQAEDIVAALGPCIGPCCFETDEDVPNAMTASLGAAALPFLSGGEGGRFHVDLRGLNAMELMRSGVGEEKIHQSRDCTFCRPEKYWSHRYTKGERGSQAALICLG